MAPFSGWVSTASRLMPLRGGSSFFTTKFPEIPCTHNQFQHNLVNKQLQYTYCPTSHEIKIIRQ